MERLAKCACGLASVKVAGEPALQSVCHCNNCKKRTGSAFGVAAYFQPGSAVGFEGQTTKEGARVLAAALGQQRSSRGIK